MPTITTRVTRNLRARGVEVYNHKQWGSQRRATYAWRRIFRRAKQPADTIVQHITVTDDDGPSKADFFADARAVEAIGHARFGSGMSYNWLVDMKTGQVAVGQPLDAKGTHTLNDKDVTNYSHDQNYAARAIAVLGMCGDPLSKKAEHSIAMIIAAMIEEGAVTRSPDYVPHSLFAYKECPCNATRDRMDEILKAAHKAAK